MTLQFSEVVVRSAYAKSGNDHIDEGDDEDNDHDDVVQDVRHLVVGLLVDVQAADDEEQDSGDDLQEKGLFFSFI